MQLVQQKIFSNLFGDRFFLLFYSNHPSLPQAGSKGSHTSANLVLAFLDQSTHSTLIDNLPIEPFCPQANRALWKPQISRPKQATPETDHSSSATAKVAAAGTNAIATAPSQLSNGPITAI